MRQKNELRPYQNRIATELYENNEKLCVVRPGGGKTVAALTAITELIRDKVIRHALVIAPKRVARVVWPDEIAQWAHTAGLRYAVLDGSPTQRLKLLASAGERDITIVGLDVADWLVTCVDQLASDHPLLDLLVIDEISRLRNPKGERAKALAKACHRWDMVWGLSGTLRPNSAQDLFMPARVVTRGKLWGRSFYPWQRQNFYPTDYMGYDWAALPGAEDRLNAEIAPLITTVTEGELIQPEPTIVLDQVELAADARVEYDRMQKKLFAVIEDNDAVVAASAAVATGKLAQIANGFVYDNAATYGLHDAKRDWLKDLIEATTEPTLLIYEYRQDLEAIRQVFRRDIPYLGAGVSDLQAADNIRRWNEGRLQFMALHPASGGHGLNLQHGGADMAWISPCWSPEYWEQTIARLNRSGQKRQVIVRVCVAKDTVDEMKLSRVHHKMTAQAAFEAYLKQVQGLGPTRAVV